MRIRCSLIGMTLLGLSFALPARGALTHRYSFNDGTANDSVGGANGVAINGAGFAGGQVVFDPAVNDGTNTSIATGQYVDLPNGLAKTRALSLKVWFTYRGGAAWQRILDFGNSTIGEVPPSDKTSTGYFGRGYIILTPENGQDHLLGQVTIASQGSPSDTAYVRRRLGRFPRGSSTTSCSRTTRTRTFRRCTWTASPSG